jgi:hypothetical protein
MTHLFETGRLSKDMTDVYTLEDNVSIGLETATKDVREWL